MPICTKCSNDVKKVYDCDHTKFEDYCVECYTIIQNLKIIV